jgi:hypothetical protein
MTWKYRYGQANPETLQTLEEPGRPLLFDTDRAFVAEVSARCNVKDLVQSLAGKSKRQVSQALGRFGQEIMELTTELADGKYMDRTGEVIQKVAAQTGIRFPHPVQRYMELSVIGARPLDQWNIRESTTKSLVFQVFRCSVLQELEAAGVSTDGLPCRALCVGSFEMAGSKAEQPVRVNLAKTLPKDGVCEFRLTPVRARAQRRARTGRRRRSA